MEYAVGVADRPRCEAARQLCGIKVRKVLRVQASQGDVSDLGHQVKVYELAVSLECAGAHGVGGDVPQPTLEEGGRSQPVGRQGQAARVIASQLRELVLRVDLIPCQDLPADALPVLPAQVQHGDPSAVT